MPNKLFEKHPRNYGKDSRACKMCSNTHGLIRKYEMNLCRRCFKENANLIGFYKVFDFILFIKNNNCFNLVQVIKLEYK